jgi:hypothetical protein
MCHAVILFPFKSTAVEPMDIYVVDPKMENALNINAFQSLSMD